MVASLGLFMFIFFVAGIMAGTSLSLLMQAVIVLLGFVYMDSSSVRKMGMDSLFPYLLFVALCVGMIIGDISYLIQVGLPEGFSISNPFIATK